MPTDGKPNALELTDVEENLRTLLLDVAQYIDNSPGNASESQVALPHDLANEKIILRFTGGWVRDKLLGVGSHDIDVAINKMTGYQFGLRMKEYLEIPGNPEKYGLEGLAQNESQSKKADAAGKSKIVGGLHKIEANPEKSKHLETVTTKILGLDIDLVNLRKETYTEESRNPQMEFGTPEEDALRRDATVNAMFYNLNTREIEDFTGQGHDDMANKIIRTPLEPFQTFKDDPLRVLRLIRFASRLGYTIESEAEKWMKDSEIKDALQAKISRERVGVEFEKMLRGPDPLMALSIIDRLTLYSTIFSDPTHDPAKAYNPDTANWNVVINFVQGLLASQDSNILVRDEEERYLTWMLSAIVPYRDAPSPPVIEGKKAPPPVATTIVREGIKATNNVCNLVTASIKNHSEISAMVDNFSERQRRPNHKFEGEDPAAPEVVGMAIRRWGSSWRSQAAFALLVKVADEPFAARVHFSAFSSFLQHIQSLNLLEAYSLKPILDGKALSKALAIPTGPWMKGALDVVMKWQLRNPGKTDTTEAIDEVRIANEASSGELTADLMHYFLALTIRPLFAKTQRRDVTSAGRKVTTTVLPPKFEKQESDEVVRTWKGKDGYALDLLRWCVQKADKQLVDKNWHLLVPPLLSITDDVDTAFKAKGCEMLKSLLDKTTPELLRKTGLAHVFEDALMPCLGYLPPLTSNAESVALLSAAYPALLSLSCALENTKNTSPSPRIKLLDTLVRKHILETATLLPENTTITAILLTHLISLTSTLGTNIVKHLPYILAMLNSILTHPFATTTPETLVLAARALQNLLLNAWPRMPQHRASVLGMCCVSWVRICEEEEGDGQGLGRGALGFGPLDQTKQELKTVVSALRDAVNGYCEWEKEVKELVAVDARLQALFGV